MATEQIIEFFVVASSICCAVSPYWLWLCATFHTILCNLKSCFCIHFFFWWDEHFDELKSERIKNAHPWQIFWQFEHVCTNAHMGMNTYTFTICKHSTSDTIELTVCSYHMSASVEVKISTNLANWYSKCSMKILAHHWINITYTLACQMVPIPNGQFHNW